MNKNLQIKEANILHIGDEKCLEFQSIYELRKCFLKMHLFIRYTRVYRQISRDRLVNWIYTEYTLYACFQMSSDPYFMVQSIRRHERMSAITLQHGCLGYKFRVFPLLRTYGSL